MIRVVPVLALCVAAATASLSAQAPPVAVNGAALVAATTTRTTGGAPALYSNKNGQPVLQVADLQPGASRSGSVILSNSSRAPMNVTLSHSLGASTGPSGGPGLATVLRLQIVDTATNVVVYDGALDALQPIQICGRGQAARPQVCPSWVAGELHELRFVVRMPSTRTADGVTLPVGGEYAGKTATVHYNWVATIPTGR